MKNNCDHEVWRPIIGYEGLYEVSNQGRVRNVKCGRILKQNIICGYYYVSLNKNSKAHSYRVHRLMMFAFIPNPDNLPCVNHKDENKLNNFVWVNPDGSVDLEKSNLEWCTQKYNTNYGTRNQKIGKKVKLTLKNHPKLSKSVVQYTLDGALVATYLSISEASRQTGVNLSCILWCCHGKRKSAGGFIWKFI